MFILIGLGISGDLTLHGKELAEKCDEIYAEVHTGILQTGWQKKLERLINKKIIILEREILETDFIIKKAKKTKIALLTAGDPLAATTHYTHLQDAKKAGIKVKVVHNSSIFISAPGKCGLQHYTFGKTVTLAYWKKNYEPTSALEIVEKNLKDGLHTLLLLDLDKTLGAMNAKNAFELIEKMERKLERKIIDKLIVLSRVGWKDEKISYGKISQLKNKKLGKTPFCFIIPGKLHFTEEENLKEFESYSSSYASK
ncbi:MAG: diphthine synthase [Candidatus Micrarchaeota archaeon]